MKIEISKDFQSPFSNQLRILVIRPECLTGPKFTRFVLKVSEFRPAKVTLDSPRCGTDTVGTLGYIAFEAPYKLSPAFLRKQLVRRCSRILSSIITFDVFKIYLQKEQMK